MIKYTIEHLRAVERYLMVNNMKKIEAIKKAGFSDPSLYYQALKRYGMVEVLLLKRKNLFLVKE